MQWPWRETTTPAGESSFPRSRSRVSTGGQIILLAGLLILLTGCAVAAALWYFRAEALLAGERLTRSLAQVIEEQTTRTLQATDQRLQLARLRLSNMEDDHTLDEISARAMLREQLRDLPFLRAMWVLDAKGVILYDSDVGNIGLSLADREYFKIYQSAPTTGFHISAPVRSRSTGGWLISTSRPLRAKDGSVRGVIVAAMEPPYFDQLWRGLDLGNGRAIALFRRDGTLMMRTPQVDSAMGRRFDDIPLFSRYLPNSPQGTDRAVSAVDGLSRIVSYRQLSAFPEFVVNVGVLEDDVFGAWWRFAALSVGVWLAGAATVVMLTTLLYRQARRRRDTETRFTQLAQAMPQIVFMSNAKGDLVFVSDQWTTVTGHPVEDALNLGWLNLVHPDDRARAAVEMRSGLTRGVPATSEHRLHSLSGGWRWRLARAVPVVNSEGQVTSWYGTSTDIDELKQAEARLKEQTEQLRMAGKVSRLAGWAVDTPEMRMVWSEEALRILDLPPGATPTLETAIERCAPPSRALATRVAQACLERGEPFDVEVQMITGSGRVIWVRSMAEALRDESGRIVRMQGAFQDITERKEAQRELLDSEQRLAALFDAAPVPMWVMDALNFHHIAVNDTAIRMYGYSREELEHMTPADLRPPEERPRIQALMSGGLPMNQAEYWIHQRKDGTTFPVEQIRRQIRYGGRDAIFTVAFDISSRVKAERELQDYLLRVQRTAEAAQAITQHRTPGTLLREVARQAMDSLGARQAAVRLLQDGAWHDAVKLGEPSASGLSEDGGTSLSVPLDGPGGSQAGHLWIAGKQDGEFTAQDQYVATELAQLASIALENVTLLAQVRELNTGLEERIAQRTRELARQEALFRTLAEQAPQPIWTIDLRGGATFFSRAWYDLFGGTFDDWAGYGWVRLVHGDDIDDMSRNWVKSAKTGAPYRGTRRLRAKDGSFHTTSYSATPVRNDDGEIVFWVGIDLDITEIKAIESALRLSNAELEAFSYSVSHDLRSPLSTVDGFSRLLSKELQGERQNERTRHYLERIQVGVGQMGQLIDALLSLAHVSRVELRRENVDLSAMAQEIMTRLLAQHPGRNVQFDLAGGLTCHGDARLLRSVLQNLLDNALKFSMKRELAHVEVGYSAKRNAFYVRDNGAGFDMAHTSKLFGTFERLHAAVDFPGTGIGLATVARIIARHGGKIWAESAVDEGAAFYFTLPGDAG